MSQSLILGGLIRLESWQEACQGIPVHQATVSIWPMRTVYLSWQSIMVCILCTTALMWSVNDLLTLLHLKCSDPDGPTNHNGYLVYIFTMSKTSYWHEGIFTLANHQKY